MNLHISALVAIAAFGVVPGQSRAANLTTLVNFCAQNPGGLDADCLDGAHLVAGLIFDANGYLFGTRAG